MVLEDTGPNTTPTMDEYSDATTEVKSSLSIMSSIATRDYGDGSRGVPLVGFVGWGLLSVRRSDGWPEE